MLASIKPSSVSINKLIAAFCELVDVFKLMFSLREYDSGYKFFVSKSLIFMVSSLFSSSVVAIFRLFFCFLSTFSRLVLYFSSVKSRLSVLQISLP